MSDFSKRAFIYESGQFICHTYIEIKSDTKETLNDVIETIKNKTNTSSNAVKLKNSWIPMELGDDSSDIGIHITLLRGHRAVYYHQIKSLVEAIKCECEDFQPFDLCLDEFRVFENNEQTKQFLCLSTRRKIESPLIELKKRLKQRIDEYALRLTDEDETNDTLAHCSLMVCDSNHELKSLEIESFLHDLNNTLDDYPFCHILVDTICIKIGNHVYKIPLN